MSFMPRSFESTLRVFGNAQCAMRQCVRVQPRASVRAAVTGVALALAAACGNGRAGDTGGKGDTLAAADTGSIGGTLIISVPTDARTLYPPAADNVLDQEILNALFDRLADMPANLSTVGDSGFTPQLATDWTWAPDSLSIAFHLHPNARWHDGQPVRAGDVQFTFKLFSSEEAGSVGTELVSNIDSVSVADSLTAVVWYKRRTPRQFFEATYNLYIVPKHVLDTVPIKNLENSFFKSAPVGSGRFRFRAWKQNESVEVVADTANYRGRAKLDRVIWAFTHDVAQSTVSTFNGEADFFGKLSRDYVLQASQSKVVHAVPYSQVGYSFLTFNLHDRKNRAAPHPIFADVRVRQALSMAVDRAQLVRIVLDSFGSVSIGPAPRALFPNPGALKPLPFDVAHAKALLDSAGWTLPAGASVRTKNGKPLAFDILVTNTSAPRIKFATLLAEAFKPIGVACTVREINFTAIGDILGKRDFDTWMGAYGVTPGLQAVPSAWGTRGITNGRNFGGYTNSQFDVLVDKALNTLQPAKASEYWVQAYNTILQEAPALWLFEERSIALLNNRVNPAPMRADAWYVGLADWTIDPRRRIARDRQGLGDGH